MDISNNHAFRRMEDFELVNGVSSGIVALIRQVVPELTTVSERFTIYCRAEAGKKSEHVFSSGSSRDDETALPSSRAVVECQRDTITYELDQFKEGNPPPGCKHASAVNQAFVVATNAQWHVPVVRLFR